jgi:hypothetical protein
MREGRLFKQADQKSALRFGPGPMRNEEPSLGRPPGNVLRDHAGRLFPSDVYHQSGSSIPREVLFRGGQPGADRGIGSEVRGGKKAGNPLHK